MNDGYVYCFSNESMPGILKIGKTIRTPEIRLNESNSSDTWRPPTLYKIEFAKKVLNPTQKEITLHALLSTERINPKREFFRVSSEKVKLMFDLIDGELWIENQLLENEVEEIKEIEVEVEKIKETNVKDFFRPLHKTKNNDTISKHQLEKDKKHHLKEDNQEKLIYNFISERVIKTNDNNDKIMKRGLAEEFKIWIRQECERCPKLEKLYDYMDKKFGNYLYEKNNINNGWYGIRFVFPYEDHECEIDLLNF